MMRVWLPVLVAVGATVYLLWPLADASWSITQDQKLLSGKAQYLAQLGNTDRPSTPNILVILADDLAEQDLSVFGGPASTPHIDQIAHQGLVFSNAYATAAICSPSRAALMTGRYQNRYGFESQPVPRYARNRLEYLVFRYLLDTDDMRPVNNVSIPTETARQQQGLPASEITLAEILQVLGYRTAMIGKWHLGNGQVHHPRAFGYDYQYGFMEAFSLYAPESDPNIVSHHHDLFWERHIWNQQRSGDSAITRNGVVIDENRYLTDAITEETLAFMDESRAEGQPFFVLASYNAPHTPFQARLEDYENTPESLERHKRVYQAMIARLDWAVGELVAHLEANDLMEETLILFASDNGGAVYTGATGGELRSGKFTQFEGGTAVPLIVHWPGRVVPGVDASPRMLHDVFSTVLDAVGIERPEDRTLDGISLLAPADESRPLFWRYGFNRAVRLGDLKLMENIRDGSVHLFDLGEDPAEAENLAASRPADVQRMKSLLDAWEKELPPPSWPRVMDYLDQSGAEKNWFAI